MKSKNKTTANQGSVNDFLSSVEQEKRKADALKMLEMTNEITGESPTLWGNSIVGYGSYHYKYESGREGDFFKAGFSPRKTSLTVYIMAGFDRFPDLMERLGKYKTGKSCLYIKKLEDVDETVLRELIKSSYNYMTEQYG